MDQIDLSGGWDGFWQAISGGGGALTDILTIVGVAILVISIALYVIKKLRGNANSGLVTWGIAIGAVLAAPQVLFPVLLNLADIVLNTIVRVFSV